MVAENPFSLSFFFLSFVSIATDRAAPKDVAVGAN